MKSYNAKAIEIVKLLSLAALRGLIGDLETVRRQPFDVAIEVVELLTAPSINTAVTTMASLDPTMQALVADVVLQLANAGPGRQNLAIALRRLIDGRPSVGGA